MRWLDGITDSMDMSLSMLWEMVEQGRLVCYSPWGHKESDVIERLNNSNNNWDDKRELDTENTAIKKNLFVALK